MSTIDTVGQLGGFGASASDLTSVPRNALTVAGKAANVVQALGYAGGAAATLAGVGMMGAGVHTVLANWSDRPTRRDGAYTALGGAAYATLGASFIASFAGKSAALPALGWSGVATGVLLGVRTAYRISENYQFRSRFAEARNGDETTFKQFLNRELQTYGCFDRIVGGENREKIEAYAYGKAGAVSREEIEELIDKSSFANLMLHFLVALLLVAWMAAMIYFLVDPSSTAVNYLFMVPSAIWLLNDTKGVPVLRHVNLGFAKLMHRVLAVKNKHFPPPLYQRLPT